MSTATASPVPQPNAKPQGMVTVPLSVINNRYYKNYREETSEDELMSLLISIKKEGLLQNLVGQWITEEGKPDMIGLVSGFCGGDGFESQDKRDRILAFPEWAKKYQTALREFKIEVKTKEFKDELDAEFTNVVENEVRSDASYFARMKKIISFIDRGVKQKTIATRLQISEANIAQMKGVWNLPEYLRSKFKEGIDWKAEGYASIDDWKADEAMMESCVKEMTRRMHLPAKSMHSMGLGHMRELAGSIAHKDDSFPGKYAVSLLKDVLKLNAAGEPTPNETLIDQSVLKIKIKDMQKTIKLKNAAPAPEGTAVPTVVDQAAAAQTTAPTVTDATGTTAAAANAAVTETKPTVAPLTGDQSKEAQILAANAAAGVTPAPLEGGSEAIKDLEAKALAKTTEDVANEVLGEDTLGDVTTATPAEEAPAGQMRQKTSEAGELKRITVAGDKVRDYANGYVSDVNDPTTNALGKLVALSMASSNYDSIGFADQQSACWNAYVDYSTKFQTYLEELEAALAPEKVAELKKKNGVEPEAWKVEVPAA